MKQNLSKLRNGKKIIKWFLLERSGLWTAQKIDLSKNVVYEAFNRTRRIYLTDGIFSGTIEVKVVLEENI